MTDAAHRRHPEPHLALVPDACYLCKGGRLRQRFAARDGGADVGLDELANPVAEMGLSLGQVEIHVSPPIFLSLRCARMRCRRKQVS